MKIEPVIENVNHVTKILQEAAQEYERQRTLPDDWWKKAGLPSEAFANAYLQQLLVGYLINAVVVGGFVE